MARALILAGLALLLTAAEPLVAQAQPASGPRDRVRRERPKNDTDAPKPPERPRPSRNRPSGGSVVVTPGSELSSSPNRTRADNRGLNPNVDHVPSFSALIGFDETRLKGVLGPPALARDEGQGAMWTYRLKNCALHVFLARDASGSLRVKAGSAGPLVRGGAAPTVDACVAEAPRSRPQS